MQREQVCRVEMDMLRILRTQKHGNIALDGGECKEKMVERREMRGTKCCCVDLRATSRASQMGT